MVSCCADRSKKKRDRLPGGDPASDAVASCLSYTLGWLEARASATFVRRLAAPGLAGVFSTAPSSCARSMERFSTFRCWSSGPNQPTRRWPLSVSRTARRSGRSWPGGVSSPFIGLPPYIVAANDPRARSARRSGVPFTEVVGTVPLLSLCRLLVKGLRPSPSGRDGYRSEHDRDRAGDGARVDLLAAAEKDHRDQQVPERRGRHDRRHHDDPAGSERYQRQ